MGASDDSRSDTELVAGYLSGERSAYECLYRRHRDRVFRVCLGVLGDREAALDVTQDVFVRLIGRLDRFDGRAAFTTWLHRVAVNACYDLLRTRRPIPVAEVPEPGPDPVDATSAVDSRADVLAALSTLTEEHRAVVVLHDVEGFQYQEIAAALEVPIGTVKSRLARARLRLAEALTGRNLSYHSTRPSDSDGNARP